MPIPIALPAVAAPLSSSEMVWVTAAENLSKLIDCIYTLPGPVIVVEKQPSPPQQQVQKPPLKAQPSLAESSKPTKLPASIVTVSPSLRSLKTRVPPAFKKAILPSDPLISCRQHPRPAPHQLIQPQSRLHPTSTSPSSDMYAPGFKIMFRPDATCVPNLMGITYGSFNNCR